MDSCGTGASRVLSSSVSISVSGISGTKEQGAAFSYVIECHQIPCILVIPYLYKLSATKVNTNTLDAGICEIFSGCYHD